MLILGSTKKKDVHAMIELQALSSHVIVLGPSSKSRHLDLAHGKDEGQRTMSDNL